MLLDCVMHIPPERKKQVSSVRFLYGALTEWPAVRKHWISCSAVLFYLFWKPNTYWWKEVVGFSSCTKVGLLTAKSTFCDSQNMNNTLNQPSQLRFDWRDTGVLLKLSIALLFNEVPFGDPFCLSMSLQFFPDLTCSISFLQEQHSRAPVITWAFSCSYLWFVVIQSLCTAILLCLPLWVTP